MKLLFTAVLLCAAATRAEDVKPVRVGASHRVDVIAPGERVETAIDRRRPITSPKAAEPRPVDRPSPRGPPERAGEHGAPSDGQRQAGAPPQQAPAPSVPPSPPHR
jgi:hypothetical protein